MTIFCDLDGVLADFDRLYFSFFGVRPTRETVDWSKVASVPHFFIELPPMHDAAVLWAVLKPFRPVIITGIPRSVDASANDKREWVRRMFGDEVSVICCRTRDKHKYCLRGDVLIDDYTKYRHLWEEAGGIFIHHRSADETIRELWRVPELPFAA